MGEEREYAEAWKEEKQGERVAVMGERRENDGGIGR